MGARDRRSSCSNLYLPDGSGLDVIRRLEPPRPHFLVITAARDMASVRRAMQLGSVHYLVKPFRFAQLEERLLAYRSLHRKLGQDEEAEQHDVDVLFGLLRGPGAPAKGKAGPTVAGILELLRGADGHLSAGDIAGSMGISRSTAQRYLSQLAQDGRIELRLHYGSTGRPEHRYRLAD